MKKKLSIGTIIFHIISLLIVLFFGIIVLLCKNYGLIVTGNYGTGSKEENEYVEKVFENDAEEKYNLYFKWFNVLHESGHIIRQYSGKKLGTNIEEEILASRYAAAYLRKFGEKEKYEKLKEIVNTAQNNLTNPAPTGMTIEEWIEENYSTVLKSDTGFNDYGYFQFNTSRDVLNKDETLEDVLYEMTGKKITIEKQELKYKDINNETSDKILTDETKILRDLKINFPVQIIHLYVNGPSIHYSTTINSTIPIFIIGFIVLLNVAVIIDKVLKSKKTK